MKKVLLTSAIALALIACGGSDSEKKTETTTPPTSMVETPKTDTAAAAALSSELQKGVDLIAKSDCLTCHKVSEKLIGPAYQDVANKYENTPANVKMLAEKVKKGGKGVWGEVAMTPHDTLSMEHAEEMVKYVLSLKK